MTTGAQVQTVVYIPVRRRVEPDPDKVEAGPEPEPEKIEEGTDGTGAYTGQPKTANPS